MPLTVKYLYYPPEPGYRGGADIERVFAGGVEITDLLSQSQLDLIEEQLFLTERSRLDIAPRRPSSIHYFQPRPE